METVATPVVVQVDLDDHGRLVSSYSNHPVPGNRVPEYLARRLPIPTWATDIFVHVHGWQTHPQDATKQAQRLLGMAVARRDERPDYYLKLSEGGFRPWVISVRWPSSSSPGLTGYRRIRDRAHEMGAYGKGQAAYVLGHLLGYLDQSRATIGGKVLANKSGQFMHLCGHSFGGRFLCEAVQWATSPRGRSVLGWSDSVDPRRPFTVDSVLIFQMAVPCDALQESFPSLLPSDGFDHSAPIRGPIVLTHSKYDRAAGIWHRRAEGRPGIGYSGVTHAPTYVHRIGMLSTDRAYTLADLDHRVVNVDASSVFRHRRLSFAGAHSDIIHPESAHLLLSLAELSR